MATLTATLSLISNDTATQPISLNTQKAITVDVDLVNVGRSEIPISVDTTLIARAVTDNRWVYLKNLDATNFVTIKDDHATGPYDIGELAPGEWCFFPVKGGVGLNLQSDTAACNVEYGFWDV